MELYIGLDVSLKETSICVVDGDGTIVCEGTVISEPSAIAGFIKAKAGSAKRIGLETGPTTTWLWHELRALGLPVICIDARHAKAALSMQINKSDRNDAVGLARIMQCGWYKEVKVKRLSCHELRAVLNSRAQLVTIKRDLENQIRGLLKNLGLVIGKAGGNVFRRRAGRADWRAGSSGGGRSTPARGPREGQPRDRRSPSEAPGPGTERRGQQTFHDGAGDRADHRLGLPFGNRRAEPLPAFQVCRRLRRTDPAPAMPRAKSIGSGRISKCGDRMLRTYLFEAAGVLLTRVPQWCKLKAWGHRLWKRIGFKKAKIAVARKLAVILHRMWRDGTDFMWSSKEAAA